MWDWLTGLFGSEAPLQVSYGLPASVASVAAPGMLAGLQNWFPALAALGSLGGLGYSAYTNALQRAQQQQVWNQMQLPQFQSQLAALQQQFAPSPMAQQMAQQGVESVFGGKGLQGAPVLLGQAKARAQAELEQTSNQQALAAALGRAGMLGGSVVPGVPFQGNPLAAPYQMQALQAIAGALQQQARPPGQQRQAPPGIAVGSITPEMQAWFSQPAQFPTYETPTPDMFGWGAEAM